ncbi:radical SAM protein [Clostridioides difficile]|uniref:radical SAM protein n=1 Tax=Clostridioides difficile TaxID=1496 RepID=UPI00093D9FDA|nr:radical SAM protein [Clostridioides difficile]EGT4750360.1 radical SAM protein [Clostridioides difficile]EII6798340.1 radical SAM protein [Clostridioides difficile]EIS9569105.1 radical SAM protein [Clostridioides difficile]EJX3481613.1 radical SAM protein [Clostridioides difficile]EKS6829918.1 radical SAM protein [Clostridioides difficile]
MRIGLIDVDSHNFPNLALMKISAYHKQQGDKVEFVNFFEKYDKVYKTKVFTFSDDDYTVINAKEVIKGGTGYDLQNKLPSQIEFMYPDYDLYDIKNIAYGYLTRGCPRKCSFCIVSEKEGSKSYKVANLNQFWKGQKEIKLLDPNILACSKWEELLKQLIDSKAWVDFTQGLDIRIMTEKKAEMINKIKIKRIHFAWDNYEFNTYNKLKEFRSKLNFKKQKLGVYVLTNFNTTFEQDLERIYKLKELEYDPYVMIFEKWKCHHEYRRLQRWVNNKIIFRSVDRFEDYKG